MSLVFSTRNSQAGGFLYKIKVFHTFYYIKSLAKHCTEKFSEIFVPEQLNAG